MDERISAMELFEQLGDRLGLRWLAGRHGQGRVLESVQTVARRPSLAGYLNAIYPNKVQILGTEELAWLDALDSRHRWETIEKIIQFRPLALVISKDQPGPADLIEAADESGTPLWSSPRRGHELLNHLQYHLARTLAPRITLHGVFMEIYSIGVLITGESGAGKSELALELITRGHRLVADDAAHQGDIGNSCPSRPKAGGGFDVIGSGSGRELAGDPARGRDRPVHARRWLRRAAAGPRTRDRDRLEPLHGLGQRGLQLLVFNRA